MYTFKMHSMRCAVRVRAMRETTGPSTSAEPCENAGRCFGSRYQRAASSSHRL